MRPLAPAFSRTCVSISLLLPVASAGAAALSWNNVAGGSASIAANWNPNQVPAGVDDLTFNVAGSFPVTFNATTAASRTQTFRQGTVTVTMNSPHTTSTGITVGNQSSDVATLTFTGGTWNGNGPLVMGNGAGSTGTLIVNDDDADIILATTSGDMTVGSNGPGTLNVTGGGRVVVADQFVAGSNAAATANVTVSGFVPLAPFPISRLEVTGTSQSRFGQGGDATVNISNGALASFGGDLVIANGSASTSTVTVQGQGLVVGATLDVAGDLLLGRNTTADSAAGVATLNVNVDGRVLIGDTLFVAGDLDGGTATLHMAAGGSIETQSLEIGPGTTLDLDGGTLGVDGGTLVYSNSVLPLNIGGAQHPVLTLQSGATSNLPLLSGGRSLVVGGGSGATLGDFDVRGGADLTISGGGDVMIGDFADDDGSMIINGTGSTMTLLANSDVFVGRLGAGRFEAELNGSVTGQRLFIASEVGASGLALFENPGTTADFDEIYVGGDTAAAGGDGQLVVNAEAVLDAPGIIRIWEPGQMEVAQHAVVNAAASIVVRGELEVENGAIIHAGHVTVTGAGAITGPTDIPGAATIDSSVEIQSGGTLTLVNGDLSIGDPDELLGFNALDGSIITVAAHTLTLNDLNRAEVDNMTINGGHILAPNGLEIVTPGQDGRLDGTGTFTGSQLFYESGGSVITSTGASGITINGQLRNNSGNIDGTKYTFNDHAGSLNPAGWVGAGAINARVVFNSGTKVFALANMTIGLNVFDGVTFNAGSEMHLNTRQVTLFDSNGVGLPNVTDMNGGDLICQNGLVVNTGRVLRGQGDVDVFNGSLSIFGTIDPAQDSDFNESYDGLGAFDIAGAYAQGANSHYFCEIAGYDNEFSQLVDFVDVSGAATLNGTLHVCLINGYVPQLGDTFTIMRFASRTGTFATEDVQCLRPLGLALDVVYNSQNVRIVVIADSPLGDMNCDCSIDFFDIDPFLQALFDPAAYEAAYPNCDIDNADINQDGSIDFFDIDPFLVLLFN